MRFSCRLINSGLHKLISTLNAAKTGQKPSKLVGPRKMDILHRMPNSHIVLTKQVSFDKYTMTDLIETNERKVGEESTVFNENHPYRYGACTTEYDSDAVENSEEDAELLYSENKHFLIK
ncbi:uncharacterized protein BDFB_007266, partial [Asbolus verrucosus]